MTRKGHKIGRLHIGGDEKVPHEEQDVQKRDNNKPKIN